MAHPVKKLTLSELEPDKITTGHLTEAAHEHISLIFIQMNLSENLRKNIKNIITGYFYDLSQSAAGNMILKSTFSHSEYLFQHGLASSVLGILIAKATGVLNPRIVCEVGLAGLLHDIGMARMPREISESRTALTPNQWQSMRKHPGYSLEMVEQLSCISDEVKTMIYQHHEEKSGQGYPLGLGENQIAFTSKIVSLADAFGALISDRPFRKAFRSDQAIMILESEIQKFDQDLVQILNRFAIRSSSVVV